MSGLMSGRWKQSRAEIVWHHRETRWQTEKTNLGLNHCATSRLYIDLIEKGLSFRYKCLANNKLHRNGKAPL
jgi:hypothetical protein